MAEPRLLQVGTEQITEKAKGESGLSSAQVGTEAKVVEKSNDDPVGVYVADTNVVNNNAKSLSVSNDSPRGKYVEQTQVLGGFERSKGDKKIVDTITVDETKLLIKKSQKETKEYIDSVIELIREGQYVVVDTETFPTLEDFLESTGEQGTVYLYPLDNTGNNYDQYIWENGVWKSLGSTEIDLSQYYTKSELDPRIFNSINASDIVNNTLTQAQYDLITNGKPTLIKGTLGGENIENTLLVSMNEDTNYYRFMLIARKGTDSVLGTFRITKSSKGIGASYNITINSSGSFGLFNGKSVPAYPTTNTSPQVLTIAANGGALSWANGLPQWYGTQTEYDNLGSYDTNTLYFIEEE